MIHLGTTSCTGERNGSRLKLITQAGDITLAMPKVCSGRRSSSVFWAPIAGSTMRCTRRRTVHPGVDVDHLPNEACRRRGKNRR